MSSSEVLRALLTNRIDHSALFPPTALSYDNAIKKTADFPRTLHYPFIIGSELVINFKDLDLVNKAQIESLGLNSPFRICIINDFAIPFDNQAKLIEILNKCAEFNLARDNGSTPQKIISFESKLKDQNENSVSSAIDQLIEVSRNLNTVNFRFFIEPDLSGDLWENVLKDLIVAIKNIERTEQDIQLGAKVRTSGPSGINRKKLALIIESISKAKLPLKVTGGLHYALPNQEREHGFFTLSVALALSRRFELPASTILEILNTQNIDNFSVKDNLSWQDLSLELNEISQVINNPHFTMGCCNPTIQDNELNRLFNKI